MRRYGNAVGRGLLVGAGLAVLYALARHYGRDKPQRLLDWTLVTNVAIRSSGTAPEFHPTLRAQLQREYEALVRDVEEPIARYVGTTLPPEAVEVHVMDRRDWIRANIAGFRELFKPLEELYRERMEKSGAGYAGLAFVGRATLSVQLGLLLGFLSQRVLGQYDASLLGKEPVAGGKLYFVEPNIQALQQRIQVPTWELRRWVALHEATHAHEFEVYPWVRGYLNNNLQEYLRSVLDDMRGLTRGGRDLVELLSQLWNGVRGGRGLLEAFMTPRQLEIASRLQALMSLAEGYSNHVMNSLGRQMLPHYDFIHRQVELRQRDRSPVEETLLRLTGLKMKMDQYALGEAFVSHVARRKGINFVNLAWQSPENLPDGSEISHPERWISRMENGLMSKDRGSLA